MDLVDSHCHIQSIGRGDGEKATRERWAQAKGLTADGAVSAAAEAGVTRLICVGCELEDSRLAVDFVQGRLNTWASVGIHPHEAKTYVDRPEKLTELKELASWPKVVAIGECGFDFYYNNSPRAAQTQILKAQIELALERDLPLIFHVREAFDEFWPVFDSYKDLHGVVHSFTDSAVNLEKALERGLYVGVNGIATFTKDQALLDVYKSVPLEKLLLETDAPFLTPVPHRGTINEPKHVWAVLVFLANLRSEEPEKLAEVTTQNARRLFGI